MRLNKLNKKLIIIIPFLFSANTAFAENKIDYNLNVLKNICKYVSNEKELCVSELHYLTKKVNDNSVVGFCMKKSDNISQLKYCLEYEQNPLIFLKYKTNKNIGFSKLINTRDDITKSCENNNNVKKCKLDAYETLKKGLKMKNWIQNFCLYNNNEIMNMEKCVKKVKDEAILDNLLIQKIPEILNVLEKTENSVKNRNKIIIDKIYNSCKKKYTGVNILDCFSKKADDLNLIKDVDLKGLSCLNEKRDLDYINCIK